MQETQENVRADKAHRFSVALGDGDFQKGEKLETRHLRGA
jgi:hypothetical protein